jgi:beta-N-acetylhexosaminidase
MNALTTEQRSWVDRTLAALSLRERIGQMILPMLTADTARPLSIGNYVARTGVGGGHMFGGPMEKCRRIAAEAQRAAKVPLLISGDFEVGPGERIPEGTHLPGRMALGAAADEQLAYDAGKVTAVEATACGYNLCYGPIVDLAAVRDYQRQVDSYGRRPEDVARLAVATLRGIQDHGMAACAKHFPGDGFDDRDQHLMTLVNPLSADQWRRQSAVPFKAAIDAGVHSIMVSCIGLPQVDTEPCDPRNPVPGVVSRFLISDLLRRQLGFDGVVISDALNMGGVSYRLRELDRYKAAIEAGNDLLIFVRGVPRVLDYLVACVENGRIDPRRIDESCRRVLELKARLNLHREAMVEESKAPARLASSPGADVARRIAEKSITLVRDTMGVVPLNLGKGRRVAVVLITNQTPERFSLRTFEDTLREGGAEVTGVRDPATDEIHDRVAAGEFDVVVTAIYFPVQYGWNTQRIHGPFSRCVMSGFPIAHPDAQAVWISFSNPNHLYELPFMDPYVTTYGASPASQRAAARALLGQIPITGRIPAELDGFFAVGDGIERPAL